MENMIMSLNKFEKELLEAFSVSVKEQRNFGGETVQLRIMDVINSLMETRSISKAELAAKIGCSRSYITGLFTADKKLNLNTLAQFEHIFDMEFKPVFDSKQKPVMHPFQPKVYVHNVSPVSQNESLKKVSFTCISQGSIREVAS